jgi:hypothetical protein
VVSWKAGMHQQVCSRVWQAVAEGPQSSGPQAAALVGGSTLPHRQVATGSVSPAISDYVSLTPFM